MSMIDVDQTLERTLYKFTYLKSIRRKKRVYMLKCLCFFSNKCGTHVPGGVGNVMKYPGTLLTNGEYSVLFPKLKVDSCRTCSLINSISGHWLVN